MDSCLVLLLLILFCTGLLPSACGEPLVVTAVLGQSAVLPCTVDVSAADGKPLTVEWSKDGLKPDVVLLFRNNAEHLDMKNPLYENRTAFTAARLQNGEASMSLFSVVPDDAGTFRCKVLRNNRPVEVAQVQVLVVRFSEPSLSLILGDGSGGLVARCDTGCWLPEPSGTFLDSRDQPLPAARSITLQNSRECHSKRLFLPLNGTTDRLTCRVQQNQANLTKDAWIPTASLSADCPNCVTVAIVAVVVTAVIVTAVICILGACLWTKCCKPGESRLFSGQEDESQAPKEKDLPDESRKLLKDPSDDAVIDMDPGSHNGPQEPCEEAQNGFVGPDCGGSNRHPNQAASAGTSSPASIDSCQRRPPKSAVQNAAPTLDPGASTSRLSPTPAPSIQDRRDKSSETGQEDRLSPSKRRTSSRKKSPRPEPSESSSDSPQSSSDPAMPRTSSSPLPAHWHPSSGSVRSRSLSFGGVYRGANKTLSPRIANTFPFAKTYSDIRLRNRYSVLME